MNEVTLILVCVGASIAAGIAAGAITAAIVSRKKSYKNINKVIKKAGAVKNYSEIGELIASQVDENLVLKEGVRRTIQSRVRNWG